MADGWGGIRKIKIMEPERPRCMPPVLAHDPRLPAPALARVVAEGTPGPEGHFLDPVVFQLVLNALDPATARYPNCFDEYPAPA